MISLKSRLTLIILIPLLLVASGVGLMAHGATQSRASERFDNSLYATLLAISSDIAESDGDALSARTRDLINNTSGGRVFYHVYAPDGVFVTGYATPPVTRNFSNPLPVHYYDATYHGQTVRVVRLRDTMQIDGIRGSFNFTVWQATKVRDAFVNDQLMQTFYVIGSLTASVGLIVWIGVSIGLRPLLDLQNAISIRSSDDLTPIRREVPAEVKGIVKTLNLLLRQVDDSLKTKDTFVSNAAHQLRNPVAGVLAMAEAVKSAPDAQAALERTTDLYDAALQTSNLANKLLSLERANQQLMSNNIESVSLTDLIDEVVLKFTEKILPPVSLVCEIPDSDIRVRGDAVMLGEAFTNLIDNALLHAGSSLTRIAVTLDLAGDKAVVRVIDDGVGIADGAREKALERFGQLNPGVGSGLGLSIVQSVVENHEGTFALESTGSGLSAVIKLPRLIDP